MSNPKSQRRLPGCLQRIACLGVCATLYLICSSIAVSAQFSPSFDTAYRAAIAVADPAARLTRLRPLVERSYECSVFQTISFGNAFLQAAAELRSDTDLYQSYTILCTGYERNREYDQSIDNGLKAVGIASRRKDYLKQIRAFQDVAFAYSSMGMMSGGKEEMETAFYYCDQALQTSKAHGIRSEEPYILTMTADVNAMNKRYDTAIVLYHRAIASRKALGLPGTLSMYTNLGIALDLHHDYDASLAAYNTADSICRAQQGGAFMQLKIASNKAILYGNMGKIQESELLASRVLADAQLSGAADIQVDMIGHLKKLSLQQGRYREAMIYGDSLAAQKERMLNTLKTAQVAEMQARYDAGVKDQEIKGQQRTILENRRTNIMLSIGIALLVLAGGAALLGLRRSRRLNRQITAQQAQLFTQKTELQRMNEMKDQLFSLIGHDLRAPLNSMMAYAALLDHHGDLPADKAKQYNSTLRHTLGDTTVLLENLLQFARTQMQSTRAYPEIISLGIVVRSIVRLLQPAMDQKRISVELQIGQEDSAYADEDMTEVIVRNLLSNAIKFSATGGAILITVAIMNDRTVSCTVQDSGSGMSPELVDTWNDDSIPAPVRSTMGTGNEKGSGLGLMLCKTFAGMMGGRLSVASTPGEGSACKLLLPRHPATV